MKRLVITLLVVVSAFAMLACQAIGAMGGRRIRGSGHIVEETREVDDFTGVELATLGTLFIETGARESLRIEAEDNLLPYIETEVHNGCLRISTLHNAHLRKTKPVNYYLTVKTLDSLSISSSGDVEAPSFETRKFSVNLSSSGNLTLEDLDVEALNVHISSSGDMRMETLHAETLEVHLSSSGNLDIAGGQVEEQDISINSSGDYNAKDLESEEAEVRLSSSGEATLNVNDYLHARLSSSGSVYYLGNPTVDATTSSSGNVVRLGR